MSDWKLTVGLEIHIELKTSSKMFCRCKNDPFESKPNSNVCPVCYGLPGSLPVINKKAVENVLVLGKALKATIESSPFWARKNYFYPDLPKAYQISQFHNPLVTDGLMTIDGADYHIARVHLEEDTAKLTHMDGKSLINYNRSGVPLMELVTRPDFHEAKTAARFCQELQRIVRSLGIAEADMEKGQMRCEANISVSQSDELGTKVEVKNINSFRSVEKAIEFEYNRQIEALEKGEVIRQETRSWVENKNMTASMRYKETSSDYRYFKEPDLPVLKIAEFEHAEAVLPEDKRANLKNAGIKDEYATLLVDKGLYEVTMDVAHMEPVVVVEVANLLVSIEDYRNLDTQTQIQLAKLRKEHGWTSATLNEVIAELKDGKDIVEITEQFASNGDGLNEIAQKVIVDNASAVADYRAGKEQALNFLVGQLMKESKGKANIHQAREFIQNLLK